MSVAAIGAALLLAGCGGSPEASKVASISTPPQSSAPNADNSGKSDQQKMLDFAKCMREHGVDMPDPQFDGDGRGQITIGGGAGTADKSKLDAAQKACQKLMPNGGEMKKPTPEELDKMRQEAKCMREHGIDMPDPDPNGGGRAIELGKPGQDPKKLEDAMKACGMGVHADAGKTEPAK
jgi:hypothetical protein